MGSQTHSTFMGRLARDMRGNVMAMTAAVLIPMIGLVGGAVDMSRMYAVKSRLQSACDAGALAGRRTMGAGLWSANTNRANSVAEKTFDLNFNSGSFGSINRTRAFTESAGTVTGAATADVPMTLMTVFNMPTVTINVACTSQMVIPNTDVMFVLDNTGSMNCQTAHTGYICPGGDNGGAEDANAKMKGLRSAVKCFYEALAKLNSSEDCGGAAPSGGLSAAVQLRFGFMPYTTNVNVGNLLPNSYFADSWTYQSRTVNTQQVWGWSTGTEGPIGWGGYSAAPTNLDNQSAYSNWTDISTSGSSTVTINGTAYTKRPSGKNSTTCPALNTIGTSPNKMLAYTDASSIQSQSLDSTTNNPPTYTTPNPPSQQDLSYSQDDDHTVNGYKYVWNSLTSTCRLQSANQRTYTKTRNGTSSKPIIWKSYDKVTGYTYKPVLTTVSGLKAGGSNWTSSLSLPLTVGSSFNIYPSGSASASSIRLVANSTVAWNGCIEEADTFRNTDGDPSDDWSPIPSGAYDADIDLVPSGSGTLWAPSLPNAVWGPYDGSGNDVLGPYTTTSNLNRNTSVSCPAEAHKLAQWPTPSDFDDYVNGLVAGGSTYHDVGLIWGARFASPDGIFASENATTPQGASIQRHIIFMTDGDTSTGVENYDAHGAEWWDRRQTDSGSAPTTTLLNNVVNARFSAVCEAIKNKNITLWVVSYGGGSNSDTEKRLTNCASPGRYYLATSTSTLISNFQDIANKIAALRLTS